MTDDNQFTEDAWSDERIEAAYQERQDNKDEKSDFAKRVEEIRERREQNDDKDDNDDGEESLDEAVDRLSGRVYRVKYPDPADPESEEREKIVADNIQPTAAGMVFHRKERERTHVYPAPVEFEELSDKRIRSWVKSRRKLRKTFQPLIDMFSS